MYSLIIDTSTERGIVALLEDLNVIFHVNLPFGYQNSQFLLTELHKGLNELLFDLKKLDFIGIGIGPGSYTGIRVGVTVAKILSFANRIPLVGVCTLDGFIPEKDGDFAVLIDAKIGGVYFQKGSYTNEKSEIYLYPQIQTIENALKLIEGCPILLTPNSQFLRAKFDKFSSPSNHIWYDLYPSSSQIARKGMEKFLRREYSQDGKLELMYLRKTQAEIEREAKLFR